MSEEEQRQLMESLISEIQIYEERQANGQWMKSITFRLPIIEEDMQLPIEDGLDNEGHVETVVCLSKKKSKPKDYVEIGIDAEDYYRIKD